MKSSYLCASNKPIKRLTYSKEPNTVSINVQRRCFLFLDVLSKTSRSEGSTLYVTRSQSGQQAARNAVSPLKTAADQKMFLCVANFISTP